MDLKEIQTLIKLVSSSKVDHLEIDRKDFSIKIKKNSSKTEVFSVAPTTTGVAHHAAVPATQADPAETPTANAPEAENT